MLQPVTISLTISSNSTRGFFYITGGGLMETFLDMEAEQPGKVIKLHLDSYVQEALTVYTAYIKKAFRLKHQ
jgi:hypothetical protein